MLDIVISNKCKKDLRRAKKRGLDLNDFFAVVEMLQRRETLPVRYRDHALTANRTGLRDCHIRKVIQRAHGGALLFGPLACGWKGASLSVVAIPAGPRRRGGPSAREGGGQRGSPSSSTKIH
ncbi:MAG: type II toxin-antitoxin system YafQ family toxin [Actinomyces dentalis]